MDPLLQLGFYNIILGSGLLFFNSVKLFLAYNNYYNNYG